jgi:hypothetical protein
MYWLETEVKKGTKITEVSSAEMLENIQGYVKIIQKLINLFILII